MAAAKMSSRRSPAAPSLVAPSLVDTQLGELLQTDGTLTEQDIQAIFAAQMERGERFGEAATRLGFLSEQDVQRALARQIQFPLVNFGESALSTEIVAAYRPQSKRAEELRTLRSELVLRWFGRGNRMLAVVEARAGDGASVLAANLAVTFAQLGERTLLIDGNLRTSPSSRSSASRPTAVSSISSRAARAWIRHSRRCRDSAACPSCAPAARRSTRRSCWVTYPSAI